MKAYYSTAESSTHHGLTQVSRPVPRCSAFEVLIRVHAAGINRADLLQIKGLYPPPPGASDIPGLEVAGVIEQAGSKVKDYAPGDAVCALLSGGGFAEYVTVEASHTFPLTVGFSMAQGAALPEALATVWWNLMMQAGCKRGDTVLIHAGASGIGSTALMLMRALGITAYTTTRDPAKVPFLESLGAKVICTATTPDVAGAILSKCDGVEAVLDLIGASAFEHNIKALKLNGTLLLVGMLSGTRAEADLAKILTKNLRIIGSTLRSQPLEVKTAIITELKKHALPLIESGAFTPLIHHIYPFEDALNAVLSLKENAHHGKIVLQIAS